MIKKGSLIHEEKPFVHVLSSNFRCLICDNCFQKNQLLKCSGCQYVRYCDRGCQRQGWIDHKEECKFMHKLPHGKDIPNAARLIARIIMKLKRGGGTEKGIYAKSKHRMFKDLMSHYSDIKEDKKRSEHLISLYEVLRTYIGEENLPNSAEFLGIYGRVIVNTFNILDPEMSSIGSGIYLGASTIDHSCQPNAVATFRGTTIYIRATEDFPKFDWSMVRISYIELLRSRKERQEDLLSQYYFLCDCPKCLDPEEDKLMNSIVCSDKLCSQPIAITQDNGLPTCSSCNKKISEELLNKFKEAAVFTQEQHEVMKNFAYLDVCKLCLEKQNGIMHPLNIDYVKTLDLAFESSIQLTKWDESENFGEKLIPGYRKYYGENHPLLGIHYMKLGKIYLFKRRIKEALNAFEKAEQIIAVTHGKTSELYKHQLCPLVLDAKCALHSNGSF